MNTTLRRNIVYNVPRAGFNFNDHFGGANTFRAKPSRTQMHNNAHARSQFTSLEED